MKRMKKALCLLALAALLASCAPSALAGGLGSAGFTAENEILTYQAVDPEKTQLVVSRTGNIDVQPLCDAFEAANPDVQVIYLDITGGNAYYMPLTEWIVRGYTPDVVISAADFFDDETTLRYFENLSALPLLQNYEAAALQRTATNYEIYWLPGPSNISAMMYNKTMFQQYGWEVPATFDAFVALCERITRDTNGAVEPWNPNAKYDVELLTALEAITYAQLLGGADNRAWYNAVLAGEETFAGHMEPYMEVIQTLVDHGILRPEHFTYSATARGNAFAAGQIAMINMHIYDADNEQYDFGFMPFPATQGEVGYLCDSYSCFVGQPVKQHTAKEAEAISRFLAFFSSPEGQSVYIGNSMKISNVKNVSMSNAGGDLDALREAVQAGHMFAVMNFHKTTSVGRSFFLYRFAQDIVNGAKTVAECIADADAQPLITSQTTAQPEQAVAVVDRDMTLWETSCFMADAYRASSGADIALIAHNEAYRGNKMRFFAGDVTKAMLTVFKPRSFANGSKLVKCAMTGRQLMEALSHPVQHENADKCVYAYSGLYCELAPWSAFDKVLAARLADGRPLDMDALYTVAFWQGTVDAAYITETLAEYTGTWEEIMLAYLEKTPLIAPADEPRALMTWP